MVHRLGATTAAVWLLLLWLVPPAAGQLSALDQGALIDGLRREGLGDLLKHLVRTEPSDDPAIARQLLINQLLLDSAEALDEAGRTADADAAAALRQRAAGLFDDALAERRALVRENYDREPRPVWQTDLAEQLLFDYLQVGRQNAPEFYEFGVPTAEQREAFEATIPEALELLADADARFFHFQGELPKEPDHTAKRINTGLWDRMMRQYYELRTPFYLAHAAYFTSLLPDAHPYYQRLGNHPRIPNQRRTPEEERARLRFLAAEKLEKFIQDSSDQYGVRRAALSLRGRARSAAGRHEDALSDLDAVLGLSLSDAHELSARLGKAMALDARGDPGAALDLLAATAQSALVREQLIYRLLVTDATHRVLLRHAASTAAERRPAALAAAYEPYQALLADPSLGPSAAALRQFIYRRWEATVPPGQDLSATPAMVVAAIAQMAREAGQALSAEAEAAEDSGAASPRRAQAREKLERAIDLSTRVLQRGELSDALRAQAMFNLAVATYYLDPRDLRHHIRAAQLMTELADEHPDQPMAEASIADAVHILRRLHALPAPPGGAAEAYQQAVGVLLGQYPASRAADDERLYYAEAVLAPAGRDGEAVAVLAPLPATHGDYFAAQRVLLYSLRQMYRAAAPEAKAAAAQRVVAEAQRVEREAQAALGAAAGQAAALVRQAAGWARLVRADMAIEHDGDLAAALAALGDFDREYAADAELLRLMLEKRIVALLHSGKVDDAAREAERMMRTFPDEAAPVIDQVLVEVDRQIDELRTALGVELVQRRQQELGEQIAGRARIAVQMATLLLDWARQEERGFTEQQLLPFQLIYAKALRMDAQHGAALAVVQPLLERFPDDAGVIFNVAEAYFGQNQRDELVMRAAPLYDRLIGGLPPEGGRYPAMWWTAWLRRLQISAAAGQGTADIPLRVRQLEATDPSLGGPALRREFKRLETQFAATR